MYIDVSKVLLNSVHSRVKTVETKSIIINHFYDCIYHFFGIIDYDYGYYVEKCHSNGISYKKLCTSHFSE